MAGFGAMGIPPQAAIPDELAKANAEVERLNGELTRFKEANAKLVRQLNAERDHSAELELQVGKLERELIQVKRPKARDHLQEMLADLGKAAGP